MYKREGKERDGGALGIAKYPNKLPWKGKKIPNYLEGRTYPNKKANVGIKEQALSRSNNRDSCQNFKLTFCPKVIHLFNSRFFH